MNQKALTVEVLTQKDSMEGSFFPGTKTGHGWMNNSPKLKKFYNSKANHYGLNCHVFKIKISVMLFGEINSKMLLIDDFSTPKKKQSISQEPRFYSSCSPVVLSTTKTKKQNTPAKLQHKTLMRKEFRKMAKSVKDQEMD
uniref:Uncharacterized protein n=1 Tax=Aegilops tauschii TaxID=37682 RepID=M8B7V8_AEGTA